MKDVALRDMLHFASRYASLGDSVQQQIEPLINRDFDDLNEGAIRLVSDKLRGYDDDLDDAIQEFFDYMEARQMMRRIDDALWAKRYAEG